MEEQKNERILKLTHVLVLTYPVQGHINPMVEFSKRLASKGLNVAFIVPISEPSKSLHSINHATSSIKIEQISDGFEGVDTDELSLDVYFELFKVSVIKSLTNFIEQHQSSQDNPAKVLVYDSVMPWALDLAIQHGMHGASFFTQSCVVSAIYWVHRGTVKLPLEDSQGQGHVSVPPVMSNLSLNDLPSFVADVDAYPALVKLVLDQFSNVMRAKWLLFNTFTELELEVIKWMGSQWPALTVGPTIPSMYLDKRIGDDKDYGLSLFKPNDAETCIKWLDSKDADSVVYISFGSLASLGEEQMEEIAIGLKRMKSNFLWVVRESEEKKLPCNFMQDMELLDDKGLVVKWCNQLQVLSHGSVGCFMTHCGWNSTMEGVSLGVPMVVMPQWTDQPTNAAFIAEVWKVGLRVKANEKGIVTGEEIESCVNEVMRGERGKEIKENSLKWRERARIAMKEGGSSENNIRDFTKNIIEMYK
ncbi:UDP-glycosyltransferase 74E2-like [Syzygium oleosum]|uniref:UDP-glycosyltransferase 74E2-like n=1 Tax=Syzygium oleosum TaxID=219896 RepID=UPI0011D1E3B9|nr:UDP-glycosyltransferase 74E2-like [Syzygium oleosum]